MKEKLVIGAGLFAAGLCSALYTIFWFCPMKRHRMPSIGSRFPCARRSPFMLAAFVSMVGSVAFLVKKDFRYDTMSASVTEIGLVFGVVNLITGMIWARIIWGIWWAWDARLTFMLVSCLMYGGYLMLRRAIDEPTQRARNSAALSILTFPPWLSPGKRLTGGARNIPTRC